MQVSRAVVLAFNLSSLSWAYWDHTWINLDTYDKIVFDDIKNNVILSVILNIWLVRIMKEHLERKELYKLELIHLQVDQWRLPNKKPNRDGTSSK